MELGRVASRSFVLLRADWSSERALRALTGAAATHALIHRQDDPQHEYWYLYPLGEALSKVTAAPGTTVFAAFGLHENDAIPALDAHTAAAGAPDRAVVTEAGMLAGFVDGAVAGNGGPASALRGGSRGPRAGAPLGAGPQRSLDAEFPDAVAPGSVEWLIVSLSTTEPTEHGLAIDLPAGEQLDVLVQPRKGFTIEGTDRGTIEIPAEGEGLPLQFKLRAVDTGRGLIRVLAFHKGESLGVIELAPLVEAQPAAAAATPSAELIRRRHATALASPSPQVPDLAMLIQERESGGSKTFSILLTATDTTLGLNYKEFGPFKLELDPGKFFADFFQEIEELPLDTPEQQAVAERKLAAKGSYLADALLPAELQKTLWDVRDQIKSVIVQSEEPWIPWELCKPSGKEGARVVDGPFLSEAYAITRWTPGIGFRRPLSLKNIALVVPADSGLALAAEERDYVLSLAGSARKVTAITPTFADVQDAFFAGTYDGWHFSGHGVAQDANPDRNAIILTGDERFTPEDLSGKAMNIGIPRPLVFINACQVGRSGMALTGIGGWARRFLGAGASAFIGAYWSVYDEPAFGFAKELYTQLLAGKPIGEATRAARAAIRGKGDPTWLAYAVFADPLATVAA